MRAVYLSRVNAPSRLVHLVAHHYYASLEAQLRGLSTEMEEFKDDHGPTRDALWYCDQTTSPDGEIVTAQTRIAEIVQRYRPENLVTQFITKAAQELLAAVYRTEQRLSTLMPG